MRSRTLIICFSLLAAALVALPAAASAATKKAKASTPQITRVTPMRLAVGQRLTIGGRKFKGNKRANTVIFRAPSGRTVFAKPRRASRKKLVVVVPSGVARLIASKPTRFKLRVLTRKFSRWTSRRLSPVIVAPSAGGNGAGACGKGDDWDADLLSNTQEAQLKTDPCLRDTDGDGVEDGYEYKSAIDLNDDEFQQPNTSLPYPGKRPYPNPLDGSDADKDFDGDVLTLAEEQALWRYTGVRILFDLTYSDGEQYSARTRDGSNRRVPTLAAAGYAKQADFLAWASGAGYRTVMLSDGAPWWNGTARNPYSLLDFNRDGLEAGSVLPGYRSTETTHYDFDLDGVLSDDERDEDADGLTNYDETHGRLTARYWKACYTLEKPHPIEYAGTDVTDLDTDGDGVRDGADDQDHDDVPNLMELSRLAASGHWDAQRECKVDPSLNSGNFAVGGGPLPNTAVVVTFTGDFGREDVPQMTASGAGLTGGAISVTTLRQGGPSVNEQQAVTITGAPTGGNFTLTFGGTTTTAIGFDAAASAVESTLEATFPSEPGSNHPSDYGRVNPFNPCLPATWSRTCVAHPSFEGSGAPFDDSPNWHSLN